MAAVAGGVLDEVRPIALYLGEYCQKVQSKLERCLRRTLLCHCLKASKVRYLTLGSTASRDATPFK
jgi:hypothetical protein